ncbi:MAG: hypothetical protein OSB42_11170 [Planctomycetota bacterium]|nr:hypothetical protein [Planctomycetota bacterium]
MREEPIPAILPPNWYRQPGARFDRTLGRVLWVGLALVLLFAI